MDPMIQWLFIGIGTFLCWLFLLGSLTIFFRGLEVIWVSSILIGAWSILAFVIMWLFDWLP